MQICQNVSAIVFSAIMNSFSENHKSRLSRAEYFQNISGIEDLSRIRGGTGILLSSAVCTAG